MPTIKKFNYTWADGVTPVNFMAWINELSPAERLEFDLADARQNEIRQQHQAQGNLVVNDSIESPQHVWQDEQLAKDGNKSDPVWTRYFDRYLAETNTTFTITYEEQ
jgi:hypothetical protein